MIPSGSGAPALATTTTTGPPKVLKIGGATASPSLTAVKKEEKSIGAAVLTIGGSASKPATGATISGAPKESKVKPADKTEAGSKITANKAVSGSDAGSAAPSGKSSPAPTTAEKAAEKREADAVLKEVEEAIDDATIEEIFGKVFINSYPVHLLCTNLQTGTCKSHLHRTC